MAYLSKVEWKKVKALQLSMIGVNLDDTLAGDRGCGSLSRGEFKGLTTLKLSSQRLMQIILR